MRIDLNLVTMRIRTVPDPQHYLVQKLFVNKLTMIREDF